MKRNKDLTQAGQAHLTLDRGASWELRARRTADGGVALEIWRRAEDLTLTLPPGVLPQLADLVARPVKP